MSDLQGAIDFRRTTPRILQAFPDLTSSGSLTLPTFPGVWTVITEIHMTVNATDGHYHVLYVGVQGSGFTATNVTGVALQTSQTDAFASWYGNVPISDSMQAFYVLTPSTASCSIFFVGLYQASENPA